MLRVEKTVFMSYRRGDFPWTLAIYQHLTQRGFDVFFDYFGIASGDFDSVILENIRARAHFLVVLTPSALDRCAEPGDWLRREIEEAIECQRNIVPLFVDGFDFSATRVAEALTGSLHTLKYYNGVGVPAEYFDAAMEKLCGKFLNVPLVAVLHPASGVAQDAVKEQQTAMLTDLLTGLLNRRGFEERLDRAINHSKTSDTSHAVLHIGLDQFRMVNDACGHRAGDHLLVQIGALLRSKAPRRDRVARLAGDEFGVLVESCTMGEAMETAEHLREAIGEFRFAWDDRTFRLGASVGVVPITSETRDVASLLTAADSACAAAKHAGRNRIYSYREGDVGLIRRRREMQWAARISSALDENRFELFRQRIQPLQSLAATGEHCEILIRMRDESEQLIAPGLFIAAAEQYGLMTAIDRWVVASAFAWLTANRDAGEEIAMCSLNLSGQSLADEQFLPYVIEQIHASRFSASCICFEITETAAIAAYSETNRFIHALKDLGCCFALDDFGTGLSSFGYLKHFPVDFLKIDGSFVKEILYDPIDREMVRSINEIGHLTGKRTIAEFAESSEIVTMLRKMGVDYAQGYGIGQPEPIRDAVTG